MEGMVREAKLESAIELDSAGTGGWHAGGLADPRTRETAERRGVTIRSIARQVTPEDFGKFDYILAMDQSNLLDLQAMAPEGFAGTLALFRSFDPTAEANPEMPDPYHGGAGGFDHVFDLCQQAARGFLDHLRSERGF